MMLQIVHDKCIEDTVGMCQTLLAKHTVIWVTLDHVQLMVERTDLCKHYIIHCMTPPRVRIHVPQFISPCFIGGYSPSLKAWDACMIADFANRLCGTHWACYYHWDAGCPHYIIDGLDGPIGWSES